MNFLNRDITTIKTGIIVHQVNCQKKMGKGLALQLKNKYFQHYLDFLKKEPILGDIVVSKINPQLYVIGIYGQFDYGYGKCFTDYEAFEEGIIKVIDISKKENLPVYVPYKIGCGLAGGDWDIILNILETIPNCYCCKVNI